MNQETGARIKINKLPEEIEAGVKKLDMVISKLLEEI